MWDRGAELSHSKHDTEACPRRLRCVRTGLIPDTRTGNLSDTSLTRRPPFRGERLVVRVGVRSEHSNQVFPVVDVDQGAAGLDAHGGAGQALAHVDEEAVEARVPGGGDLPKDGPGCVGGSAMSCTAGGEDLRAGSCAPS
jgi:hypothetical protein